MFNILGFNFLFDAYALNPRPTEVEPLVEAAVTNGIFDEIEISSKVDATTIDTTIPTSFGPYDVILCNFNGNIQGGSLDYYDFDLMDASGPDVVLDIPNGKVIKKNYVGKNIKNYNSMLVLSHFKGHPMGGFGGAIKQLSIGVASSYGKMHIHTAGSDKEEEKWTAPHDLFLESMADAASSVVKYFNGNMAFINIMKNMSVDCDCCAVAEDPCLKDIGVLASLDPIAIDQACIDLVLKSKDPGVSHFMERVNSRNGLHTIEAAEKLGFGSTEYELIEV